MRSRLPAQCIDINTSYCPCILAETNHCVYCSHLKGEDTCNCNWSGVCILNEKFWQPIKLKNKWSWDAATVRTEVEAPVIKLEPITEHTYRAVLIAPGPLAKDLDRPGSFVFLRRTEDPDFFKFPVGIMSVNSETIEVVIEAIGPKSSRLIQDSPPYMTIRGPYWNGIFGQPWVEKISHGSVLVMTGGMGQPPALPIIKTLVSNHNKVTAMVAPGKLGKIIIDQQLATWGVEMIPLRSMRRDGMADLRSLLQDPSKCPDLIVSAGPDEQHSAVIHVLKSENKNIPMAATNNATMCCGEGICGSCDRENSEGKKVRTCKIQTDYFSFI